MSILTCYRYHSQINTTVEQTVKTVVNMNSPPSTPPVKPSSTASIDPVYQNVIPHFVREVYTRFLNPCLGDLGVQFPMDLSIDNPFLLEGGAKELDRICFSQDFPPHVKAYIMSYWERIELLSAQLDSRTLHLRWTSLILIYTRLAENMWKLVYMKTKLLPYKCEDMSMLLNILPEYNKVQFMEIVNAMESELISLNWNLHLFLCAIPSFFLIVRESETNFALAEVLNRVAYAEVSRMVCSIGDIITYLSLYRTFLRGCRLVYKNILEQNGEIYEKWRNHTVTKSKILMALFPDMSYAAVCNTWFDGYLNNLQREGKMSIDINYHFNGMDHLDKTCFIDSPIDLAEKYFFLVVLKMVSTGDLSVPIDTTESNGVWEVKYGNMATHHYKHKENMVMYCAIREELMMNFKYADCYMNRDVRIKTHFLMYESYLSQKSKLHVLAEVAVEMHNRPMIRIEDVSFFDSIVRPERPPVEESNSEALEAFLNEIESDNSNSSNTMTDEEYDDAFLELSSDMFSGGIEAS